MYSSNPQPVGEFNHILFASDIVTIGRFHAPVEHPRFNQSGLIQRPTMVFPRTSVAIKHARGSSFHANEKLITFYNKDQDYSRQAYDARGDICDWFEFCPNVLSEVCEHYKTQSSPSIERPFAFAHLPSQTDNFVRQRMLINYLSHLNVQAGKVNHAQVEEVALSILTNSLAPAESLLLSKPGKVSKKHQDLTEQAQYLLTLYYADNDSLGQLAERLNCSVFHLCRVFKKVTGQSIHQYKNELRLRQALGRITQGDDLSRIALDLGFSSHSHFSTAFGRYFSLTPKQLRLRLFEPFG